MRPNLSCSVWGPWLTGHLPCEALITKSPYLPTAMMKGAVLCYDQITGTLIKVRVKIDMIDDGIETNQPRSSDWETTSSHAGREEPTPHWVHMCCSRFYIYTSISVVHFLSRYKIDMMD